MTDPFDMILKNAAKFDRFPVTSRYFGTETTSFTRADGTVVTYVVRRFIPQPEHYATLTEHTVREGDRLDNIAAHYLGDPEQFWRICDANATFRPDELTEAPGATVRITLPDGIPGATSA
jgi:hypothetical protein